jgi:hypothetical protein
MLGLEPSSAETRSAARGRSPWLMESREITRSEPSSATARTTGCKRGCRCSHGRCQPQAWCRDRSPSGRRGDEVAVKALRSVISAASSGVTMKGK